MPKEESPPTEAKSVSKIEEMMKNRDLCGNNQVCKDSLAKSYSDYMENQVAQLKQQGEEETLTIHRLKSNERTKSTINLVYTILKWILLLTLLGMLVYLVIEFVMAMLNPASAALWIQGLFALFSGQVH